MARKIALFLGLFVAFLPYLGFPEDLDTVLYTIAGLVIAFLAWSGKRPTPMSSIEEMEGELHDATRENDGHDHSMKSTESHVPPATPVVPNTHAPQNEVTLNTTVSVDFSKQRPRNLKKRITQEGSEPTT